MKRYLVITIILLIAGIAYLVHRNRKLNIKYQTSVENVKAYDQKLSNLENSNRVFKFTIEQLNYFNDSIIRKINDVRKELKIKDKTIQQLQYEASNLRKTDTIVLKDTIFKEPGFRLDTIVGDKWVENHIVLEYPSAITVSSSVELERYTFIVGKKETVAPPKKFFLWRWFQKKHIIVEVKIKEKNPYVKDRESRYIQIIK